MRSCQIFDGSERLSELHDQRGPCCKVVLGVDAPYRIAQVSAGLLDLFQMSPESCIGRTLGVLGGPGTATETLMFLIQVCIQIE